MVLEHIFYADDYTKRVAEAIAENQGLPAAIFRIRNPTFSRWGSWLSSCGKTKVRCAYLPSRSVLIGGNRWRHHFALHLTDLPMVSIDAHTDMSFDEMIFLKLVRPYNWLYFRLLGGCDVHLVLPYDDFKWKRWDIAVPEDWIDRFHLYAFDRRRFKARVSLSFSRSSVIEVEDPETSPLLPEINKQISLDWEVTREISEDRVERLVADIAREGDVCDIWLDEGRRGKRRTLRDDVESCSRICQILSSL